MILLDENIIANQVQLLRRQGVHCRHVGHDFESEGIADDNILPVLHRLRQPTFFTRDLGLYARSLCHPGYCLICLDVDESNVAAFVRGVLRHRSFNTASARMGRVLRVNTELIRVWRRHASAEQLTAL